MKDIHRIAVSDGITIGLGYLPVAMAFGITAKPLIDLTSTMMMSAFNFTGAGQFLTLQMLETSTYTSIIIAILILNARLFVMSFKTNYDLRKESTFKRIFASLFITDESFAVTSQYKGEMRTNSTYFITGFIGYLFWVIFTFIGYYAGEIMSEELITASGIALYALFIALLMPAVKHDFKSLIIAILGMSLHFFFIFISIPSGISIVMAMIIAAFVGLILEEKTKEQY